MLFRHLFLVPVLTINALNFESISTRLWQSFLQNIAPLSS